MCVHVHVCWPAKDGLHWSPMLAYMWPAVVTSVWGMRCIFQCGWPHMHILWWTIALRVCVSPQCMGKNTLIVIALESGIQDQVCWFQRSEQCWCWFQRIRDADLSISVPAQSYSINNTMLCDAIETWNKTTNVATRTVRTYVKHTPDKFLGPSNTVHSHSYNKKYGFLKFANYLICFKT